LSSSSSTSEAVSVVPESVAGLSPRAFTVVPVATFAKKSPGRTVVSSRPLRGHPRYWPRNGDSR